MNNFVCDVCAIHFQTTSTFQSYCSPECALAAKVTVDPETGCWLFQGFTDNSGYGHMRWRGKNWSAHRFSQHHINGSIPKGYVVRHKCDNPPCCNPDHLECGTYAQNWKDLRERGFKRLGSEDSVAR